MRPQDSSPLRGDKLLLTNQPTKCLPSVFEERCNRRVLRTVAMEDVTHFHSAHKYVHACHAGGEVMLDNNLGTLTEFEAMLGEEWIRAHRATIVRKSCIESARRTRNEYEITLRGSGARVRVSRRQIRVIRQLMAAKQAAQAV